MKKINLLSIVLFLCFVTIQYLYSQDLPASARKELQLSISPIKKIYKYGETISVNVSWKNISDRNITYPRNFFLLNSFFIKDSKGEHVTFLPGIESFTIHPKKQNKSPDITLRPGETYTLTQDVFPERVLLPGKYSIKKHIDSLGEIDSNIIEIEIIPK